MKNENIKYERQKEILIEKCICDIKIATIQNEFDERSALNSYNGLEVATESGTCI